MSGTAHQQLACESRAFLHAELVSTKAELGNTETRLRAQCEETKNLKTALHAAEKKLTERESRQSARILQQESALVRVEMQLTEERSTAADNDLARELSEHEVALHRVCAERDALRHALRQEQQNDQEQLKAITSLYGS
eukprot:COSAG02_NODE_22290_length_757_cov_1.130699_1_plen_138_part_10